VSGNVSLYNESKATGGGSAILPTPAIGGVGLLEDWEKSATIAFKAEGHAIWIVGRRGTQLGQSLWLRELRGQNAGAAPHVDLQAERTAGELVRRAVADGLITAVHDCSDGGVLVAIAEMALAGGIGAHVEIDHDNSGLANQLFGEDQNRYVVTVADPEDYRFVEQVKAAGLPCTYGGRVGGDTISIGDMPGTSGHHGEVSLADLRAAHEGFFPKLMGADAALA
jgi:phosphoribosylformylglycinamidine synthase